MILKNVDEVLAGLEAIFAEVDHDEMFDMIGRLHHGIDECLPFDWETIEKLYPIRDGINFMKENYPNLYIRLSVTEIGFLTQVKVIPKLTAVI